MEALALKRDRSTKMLDDFPDQVSELLAFLNTDFPPQHPFARIRVAPQMPGGPDVWMLGSSMWSASAAAEFGLPYAFAHFFSGESSRAAIETYQHRFTPSRYRSRPEAMVAVGAICAPTQQEAEFLASSVRLLQWRIRQGDRSPVASPEDAERELKLLGNPSTEAGEWPRYFVGTPAKVKADLEQMAAALGIGEIVVNTIIWDHATRLRSYELLAEAFNLSGATDQAEASVV
jgi:luciferase family oxidoreductase group 1